MQVFSSKTEQIVASHQIRIHKEYPNPGWVEQDPTKIIDSVISTIEETIKILQNKNINPADIVTVGITNQRETTLVWDKITGQPLSKAIGTCLFLLITYVNDKNHTAYEKFD